LSNLEVKKIQENYQIIGREDEIITALIAAHARKHILFEGGVGVGKTAIATALAKYFDQDFNRIDGDERYSWDTFIPGPLTEAMMDGAFFFINELNRMPEGTQNVLLSAMDEGQIIIPKIGTIKSKSKFLIIATQNPEEFVGTSRLSEALKDRFVWVRLDYQSEEEEKRIVLKETGFKNEKIISTSVKIIRKTREEPEIRRGSSIRGAIDIVDLVCNQKLDPDLDENTWINVTISALATKIELEDNSTQGIEKVIKKIVMSVLNENLEDSNQSSLVAQNDKLKKNQIY
jgi:MoxR-like ATPase